MKAYIRHVELELWIVKHFPSTSSSLIKHGYMIYIVFSTFGLNTTGFVRIYGWPLIPSIVKNGKKVCITMQ